MQMMRVRSLSGLLCFALILATAGSAAAQEFRATIKGTVVDTSQAALPGATVTAQNQDTNEVASATTNNEGAYTIPFLRPGVYTLTVEMSGFQKNTRTNLRLSVGETASINVQLGVGLTETVNVVSETPLLETSKADRGTVIDSARIAELPLQSRSPMALAVLVAGVNYNAQAIYLRPFDNGALADWSMNGGQNRNNEFLLDGAPNNANQGGNNIAYVPPAEAVQEMKIQTNSYDAQYGRTAGGVVNMTLKSGTNSFHGVGYEFMRRKALAANSFLLNSRQSPKTDQYIDQYGFSVDGPIFKNKTFFLFTGEKYREGTPAPQNSTVPTAAMKQGDFSGLVDAQGRQIVIYDPNTGRDVNGVWTRDPFPGNRIPADRINSVARALLQYYPDPNYTTAGVAPWQSNLDYAEHYNKDLFWNWVGKVDHNFGTNDRAFFRWGENERNEVRNTTAIRSGPAQNGQLPLWRANRAMVGDWVHIFGPGTVFNLRGSYTYFLEWSYSEDGLGFDSTTLGWPSSLVGQMPSKAINGIFPQIEIDQFVTLSRGSSPNRNRNYTIQPNVSLTRGAHNIRSGLDIRWTNVFNENYNNSGGRITFDRAFTRQTINSTQALEGNAFASFLLGAPNGGSVDVNPKPHYEWFFAAPWIQDDWRLNNKMTLNLGFRWDVNGSVKESSDMLNYAFDPTIVNPVSSRVGQQVMGGLRFAGVNGAPDRPWKLDKNNYQFRVGTAYQLNEKTVLRAGYGMTINPLPWSRPMRGSYPFDINNNATAPIAVEAAYVGTKTDGGYADLNRNVGVPGGGGTAAAYFASAGTTAINESASRTKSRYKALQIALNRPFRDGLLKGPTPGARRRTWRTRTGGRASPGTTCRSTTTTSRSPASTGPTCSRWAGRTSCRSSRFAATSSAPHWATGKSAGSGAGSLARRTTSPAPTTRWRARVAARS
jgi:hypothetical protein